LLYKEIMSACRALEQPLTIAYLGPEGTFSEAAAIKHFGHAPRACPAPASTRCFRRWSAARRITAWRRWRTPRKGAVNRTLDLLLNSPLKICGEVMLRVRQHLMRKGEGLEGIKVVYSHAQSLGQCHEWLNQHLPGVNTIRVTSNGEAARMAAENPDAAAIAGELAAERYGLNIVARDIEDDPTTPPVSWCWGRKRPRLPGATRPRWCCRRATSPAPCWNC
jgi:chorismate mutase/prephenate dehydratase